MWSWVVSLRFTFKWWHATMINATLFKNKTFLSYAVSPVQKDRNVWMLFFFFERKNRLLEISKTKSARRTDKGPAMLSRGDLELRVLIGRSHLTCYGIMRTSDAHSSRSKQRPRHLLDMVIQSSYSPVWIKGKRKWNSQQHLCHITCKNQK